MTDKDRYIDHFTPKITPLYMEKTTPLYSYDDAAIYVLLNNDKNDRLEITGVIIEAQKEQ